jgi:hypothetical protein
VDKERDAPQPLEKVAYMWPEEIDNHLHAARSYLAVISGYTQLIHRAHLADTDDTAETVRRTEAVLRAVTQLASTLDALERVVRLLEREGHPP